MKKIRIMIFNVGYMRGITSMSLLEYLLKFHNILLDHNKHKNTLSQKIATEIEKLNPDIVFLPEVQNKSYLNKVTTLFSNSYINSKYGRKSVLNYLPFFRGNCNGLFMQQAYSVADLYFKYGRKKLVYKVDVGANLTIIFSHFSLGKRTRKKQFAEIQTLIGQDHKKEIIIAGDFNIFHGVEELDELSAKLNLNVVNGPQHKTFPSNKPRYAIDLFLATTKLQIDNIQVLKHQLSDHLPVVLDILYDDEKS